MSGYIATSTNSLTITYDDTTHNLEILPNQLLIIKDKLIDTSLLSATQRIVTIPNLNTTYHLRFTLNGEQINSYTPSGSYTFYLVDVSNTSYNPNNLTPTDPYWFSFVNDMPVAIITVGASFASSNVTINPFTISEQIGYLLSTEGLTRYRSSDLEFTDPYKGVILVDRATNTKYRLYISGGLLQIEIV